MSMPLGVFFVVSTLNLEVANRLENACTAHGKFRFILKIIDHLARNISKSQSKSCGLELHLLLSTGRPRLSERAKRVENMIMKSLIQDPTESHLQLKYSLRKGAYLANLYQSTFEVPIRGLLSASRDKTRDKT